MIKKPLLIIIAGPNGSGKTTVTSKILEHEWTETCLYVNHDTIAQEKFGDWNSPEAIRDAVVYASEIRENAVLEKQDIIFETVLSSNEKIEYIKKAKDAGFFIRLFFVCTDSPKINASRITNRVLDGGHDVPITKIISRYGKSIANACVAVSMVDRAYFYDNSANFEDAKLLFRTKDGFVINKLVENLPTWAKEIFETIN